MTTESILLIISLAVPGVIITAMLLINYEKHIPEYLEDELLRNFSTHVTSDVLNTRVDFSKLATLPSPVERYLKNVLTDGQSLINIVKTKQTGELRIDTSGETWYPFIGTQLVTPITAGFVWGARIKTRLKTWLRISDGYISGVGISKVDFLSIVPLASESNVAELNSGALYRYLAEAVWYPTALLPESGVEWTPIDNHSALATLTDNNMTISLKFSFNDDNEVTGIYTNSRHQKCNGAYYVTAWEGHFRNYTMQSGVRIPSYGEVGWYTNGEWECVWKANITNVKFNFDTNA